MNTAASVENKKQHACKICEKVFKIKFDLFRHERIQSGEKPYSCDVCNKSFVQKSLLTKHKLTHSD